VTFFVFYNITNYLKRMTFINTDIIVQIKLTFFNVIFVTKD